MPKFNKYLSQLESVYQISEPVVKKVEPIYISDFIHHIFENQENFDVSGLSKQWFKNCCIANENKAFKFINNILENNGHIISKKCIFEGIEIFKNEQD